MMMTPGKQEFAEGRYHSRELSVDLPGYLEILTRSHRNFSVRAAQELRRAERYRLFMSLIIVHGDQVDIFDGDDPERALASRLAGLTTIVRANCRVSDLVSGVEDCQAVISDGVRLLGGTVAVGPSAITVRIPCV